MRGGVGAATPISVRSGARGAADRAQDCAAGSGAGASSPAPASPSRAWPPTPSCHPTGSRPGPPSPRPPRPHRRRRRRRRRKRVRVHVRRGLASHRVGGPPPSLERLRLVRGQLRRKIGVWPLVRPWRTQVTTCRLDSTTGAPTPSIRRAGARRVCRPVERASWRSTPRPSDRTTPSCATSWPTSSATQTGFTMSRRQTTAPPVSGSRISTSSGDQCRLRRPARVAKASSASNISGARHILFRFLSVNSTSTAASTSGCRGP